MTSLSLSTAVDMRASREAARELLEDLQGNILQPHGRRNAALLCLSFGSNSASFPAIRSWIGRMTAEEMNNAWSEYCEPGPRRSTFCSFLLTARGYRRLGEAVPEGTAFRSGMASRGSILNDPPPTTWEVGYQDAKIDAMLVLADDDAVRLAQTGIRHRQDAMAAGAVVLADEPARQLRSGAHDIEHFGYVDGISQPEFLREVGRSSAHWNASAGLDLVLVEEAGGGHYGSYLVFRKLEQDVALWNDSIAELARTMKIDPELAGALAVGRFKDGTPVVEHEAAQGATVPSNDFDFSADQEGLRCPFHAHIRKMNPRNEACGAPLDEQRRLRIARRGITYGLRPDLHPGGRPFPPPRTGVGLLFMCYQADIENQFECIQSHWANDPDHCRPGSGLDPLIGQSSSHEQSRGEQLWPMARGNPEKTRARLERAVRLRGGEYFFAPSLSFLRSRMR